MGSLSAGSQMMQTRGFGNSVLAVVLSSFLIVLGVALYCMARLTGIRSNIALGLAMLSVNGLPVIYLTGYLEPLIFVASHLLLLVAVVVITCLWAFRVKESDLRPPSGVTARLYTILHVSFYILGAFVILLGYAMIRAVSTV